MSWAAQIILMKMGIPLNCLRIVSISFFASGDFFACALAAERCLKQEGGWILSLCQQGGHGCPERLVWLHVFLSTDQGSLTPHDADTRTKGPQANNSARQPGEQSRPPWSAWSEFLSWLAQQLLLCPVSWAVIISALRQDKRAVTIGWGSWELSS